MWCLCMGVVIVLLLLLGVCDCVSLLVVCCDGQNMMVDVVLVCWCIDCLFVFVGRA